MPIKQQRRYWTLSTDGKQTPIEVIETIEEEKPVTDSHQQIQQYVQMPAASPASMQPVPQQTTAIYQQPVMVRSQPRSPIPFIAAGAGLFLCFYSWSASAQIESLEQQNQTLERQNLQLRAEVQALKEMAAIVR